MTRNRIAAAALLVLLMVPSGPVAAQSNTAVDHRSNVAKPAPALRANHVITDAQIDLNIDASVLGADRDYLRRRMKELAVTDRDNVVIIARNKTYSNRPGLLKAVKMIPVQSDIPARKRPVGLNAAGISVASTDLSGIGFPMLAQSSPCVMHPTSSTTGPFRLTYSECGYSYADGSISLPPCGGGHTNLPDGSNGGVDAGYAYLGAFTDTGDNADAGFLYSVHNDWWSPYLRLGSYGGATTTGPAYSCGMSHAMRFYVTDTQVVLHIEGTTANNTTDFMGQVYNNAPHTQTISIDYSSDPNSSMQDWNAAGNGEFVKRMTTIAQIGGSTNTTNNEYFGVDPASLSSNGGVYPKIGWYAFTIGTNYGGTPTTSTAFDSPAGSNDEYPKGDVTRVFWGTYQNDGALDEQEGLYMHS